MCTCQLTNIEYKFILTGINEAKGHQLESIEHIGDHSAVNKITRRCIQNRLREDDSSCCTVEDCKKAILICWSRRAFVSCLIWSNILNASFCSSSFKCLVIFSALSPSTAYFGMVHQTSSSPPEIFKERAAPGWVFGEPSMTILANHSLSIGRPGPTRV